MHTKITGLSLRRNRIFSVLTHFPKEIDQLEKNSNFAVKKLCNHLNEVLKETSPRRSVSWWTPDKMYIGECSISVGSLPKTRHYRINNEKTSDKSKFLEILQTHLHHQSVKGWGNIKKTSLMICCLKKKGEESWIQRCLILFWWSWIIIWQGWESSKMYLWGFYGDKMKYKRKSIWIWPV